MTHKSEARKAAGRGSFARNPALKVWAQASSQAYKDYKEGKVADVPPGLLLKDLMKVPEYNAHRANVKEALSKAQDQAN